MKLKIIKKLKISKLHQRITSTDITLFLQQFTALMTAGIPIIDCIDLLEKSQEKTSLRLLMSTIKRNVSAGKNLFSSFQLHKQYFNELTCQLIKIGEHTGRLETMLIIITQHREKNAAFKKRISQTLFYPCVLSFLASAITLGMLLFIIPRFAELFQDLPNTLPAITRWIFSFSALLRQHVYLFSIIIILFFIMGITQGKHKLKQQLRFLFTLFPPSKRVFNKILLAHFARHLAMTLSAGMPLTEALKLMISSPSQIEFNRIIALLHRKINAGMALHQAMQTCVFFPPKMIHMIKIGEEAGKLDYMLLKMADFLEAETDQLLTHVSKLLEPLIMLVLGVLIGGLIVGMYLPIFKLGSAL